MDFITDVFGSIDFGDMFGGIFSEIENFILNGFRHLFYYIAYGFCRIIQVLDLLLEVFCGSRKVYYKDDTDFLINVFFRNEAVSNVYWGMALIGIIFAFVFAMIAVVRKMFDLQEKEKRSLGQILASLAKTVLLILSMNIVIIIVLNTTNILLQQVDYLFDNAYNLNKADSIDFTEEQYAAMAKCLNTIGNYSLNPSYNSTYNVNACYNAIRPELDYLYREGVFEFYYSTEKEEVVDGVKRKIRTDSWQSVLQKIVESHNIKTEQGMDIYDAELAKAIVDAMDLLKRNQNIRPLSHADKKFVKNEARVPLDRFVFLTCTLEAAHNSQYNVSPDIADSLRGPFYYGDKSIYSFDQVNEVFEMMPWGFNYILMLFYGFALIWNLALISMTCVNRIFNMIMLYLISPLVFAVEPLDDGTKRKQWITAFVVQSMGIFGTVISMRVLMLFIPIITSPDLVLYSTKDGSSFGAGLINLIAKCFMILVGFEVVKKANGIISGILADSAGWQSIQAGDMGNMASGFQHFFRHPIDDTKNTFMERLGMKPGGGGGGGGGGSEKKEDNNNNDDDGGNDLPGNKNLGEGLGEGGEGGGEGGEE